MRLVCQPRPEIRGTICRKTHDFPDTLYIYLVHELNSVDGGTYQSLLPQPSVGQFRLVEWGVRSANSKLVHCGFSFLPS